MKYHDKVKEMKKTIMQILTVLFIIGCLFQFVFAGGIDNLQNFSARYTATGSRNAATDGADIAAYNPAGIIWQKDGLTMEGDIQYLFNEFTHEYNDINSSERVERSQNEPSIIPSFFTTYKSGKWGAFGSFTVNGGGGKVSYDNGNFVTNVIEGKLVQNVIDNSDKIKAGVIAGVTAPATASVTDQVTASVTASVTNLATVGITDQFITANGKGLGIAVDTTFDQLPANIQAQLQPTIDALVSQNMAQEQATIDALVSQNLPAAIDALVSQNLPAAIESQVSNAYITNEKIEAESKYLTLTAGGTYQFNDKFSGAAGIRFIQAKKSVEAFADTGFGELRGGYDQEADGFGFVASVNFAPTKDILLAVRYESEVNLEFETEHENTNELGRIMLENFGRKDNGKYDRDLPGLIGLGVSWNANDKLNLNASLTYYMSLLI